MAGYARRRCQWLSLVCIATAAAQEPAPVEVGGPPSPSPELLQYLDEFSDDTGEFVDPEELGPNNSDDKVYDESKSTSAEPTRPEPHDAHR